MGIGMSDSQEYNCISTKFSMHLPAAVQAINVSRQSGNQTAQCGWRSLPLRIVGLLSPQFVSNTHDRPKVSLFQINRESGPPKVEAAARAKAIKRPFSGIANKIFWIESLLIFLAFLAFAGQLPPDVNESHYLTKAKHFWNPDWCPGDLFLGSAFAHWLFFWLFGWLTKFVSLAVFAWIGRVATWLFMAVSWQFLASQLFRTPLLGLASALTFLVLNERFHLAGEWVVGGFEAKGIAYGFVILAIGFMVGNRWSWAWPLLGLAAAFHVLVGGWAFLATGFAWLVSQWRLRAEIKDHGHSLLKQLPAIILGLGLLAIGAIPPLVADRTIAPEAAASASLIYVNQRISHHLIFGAFATLNVARFVFLIAVFFMLHRWTEQQRVSKRYPGLARFYWFACGSLIISFAGLVLSGLSELNQQYAIQTARLLRFYWFRLSDFTIPAGVSLILFVIIEGWLLDSKHAGRRLVASTATLAMLAASLLSIAEKYQDVRPFADRRSLPNYENAPNRTIETYRNWRKVCHWISEHTPDDAIFLTPQQQQTFKWYAGRTEVVNWKDIPQDAESIVEWSKRVDAVLVPQQRLKQGLMAYSDDQIRILADRYGADYLLIPQRELDLASTPTRLKQVYPSTPEQRSTYVVLELNQE
jgi:hypothetical protein